MIRPRLVIPGAVLCGLAVHAPMCSAQAFDSDLATYVRYPRITAHEWRGEALVARSTLETNPDTAVVERTVYATAAAASYGWSPRVMLRIGASHTGLGEVHSDAGLLDVQWKIADNGHDAFAVLLGAGAVRRAGTATFLEFDSFGPDSGDSLGRLSIVRHPYRFDYTTQLYHAIASWTASVDSFASYATIDAEFETARGASSYAGYEAVGGSWSHGRFRVLGEAALLPGVQRAVAGGLWFAPAAWLEMTGYAHYLIDDRRAQFSAGMALRR